MTKSNIFFNNCRLNDKKSLKQHIKILTGPTFYDNCYLCEKIKGMGILVEIRLVLCDDDAAELKELREYVTEYMNSRGFYGEAVCFSSPAELLQYSRTAPLDRVTVYLLDIIMPDFDGIDLGKRIRETDKSSAVIYISSSKEYSLDAFSVRAFSYLVKPFSQEKLFAELDECLDRIQAVPQKLMIKTTDRTVSVPIQEIIAVEYLDHRLIYQLANGEKLKGAYYKQSFDVQAQKLHQIGVFLKISASYLINSLNVSGVKADEFIMRDGSQYKITRKYADSKKLYMDSEIRRLKTVCLNNDN